MARRVGDLFVSLGLHDAEYHKALTKAERATRDNARKIKADFDMLARSAANYFGNRLIAFAHSLLNDVYLRDPLTGLRVLRWNVLRSWMPKSDGFDIEVELNNFIAQQDYKIVEVEIPYRPRLGEKKLHFKHGFTIMKRIISEAFNNIQV